MHTIDHIGIAVTDLDEEIKRYQRLFSVNVNHREKFPTSGVEVAFLDTPNGSIELLTSLNRESPLQKFLTNRGPGLHHICFRVPDVAIELKRLKNEGCTLIDEAPRLGARNTLVAFVHPKSFGGVLVEYCQDRNSQATN